MPPRAKITKDMVIDAAFAIAREIEAENINARTVSKRLNCSTQPVMYHFSTIKELKKATYIKANQYHTNYLMNIGKSQEKITLEIGLKYIRFAIKEPNLFRFLFQSGYADERSFLIICMFAHGYASIIANNSLEYDEELIKSHLKQAYRGAILAVQEKTK